MLNSVFLIPLKIFFLHIIILQNPGKKYNFIVNFLFFLTKYYE